MHRIYTDIIKQHFETCDQMLFLSGPRQTGKTTLGKGASGLTENFLYLNWDEKEHRKIITQGTNAIISLLALDRMQKKTPLIVFDELHKYPKWKHFLKGFYDVTKSKVHIIVTGSARLNIYKKGGDSLMGRYFPYRIHPFSLAECMNARLRSHEIGKPLQVPEQLLPSLMKNGGFPEPFLKDNRRFTLRWRRLHQELLLREDIRDLSHIHEINQLEILAELLKEQVGQLINYTNLANKVNVTVDTIRRWISTLYAFYYCYQIKPWSKNVGRSLTKTPKIFLWDWSSIDDRGARAENFVASHLLKSIHLWTDYGLGDYGLYFIRDKEKREVDFLVTKNKKPWFLIEVKCSSNNHVSKNLAIFQEKLGASHAFQVAFDMPTIVQDCFEHHAPMIVPVQTLLSQLI